MPFVLEAEDWITAIAYIHYHWPECTQYKPFAYRGFSRRMRHLARRVRLSYIVRQRNVESRRRWSTVNQRHFDKRSPGSPAINYDVATGDWRHQDARKCALRTSALLHFSQIQTRTEREIRAYVPLLLSVTPTNVTSLVHTGRFTVSERYR